MGKYTGDYDKLNKFDTAEMSRKNSAFNSITNPLFEKSFLYATQEIQKQIELGVFKAKLCSSSWIGRKEKSEADNLADLYVAERLIKLGYKVEIVKHSIFHKHRGFNKEINVYWGD